MLRVFPMIGAAAMILTGSAIAEVNVEYGQEYEETYLLICERDHSHRVCSCGMTTLQEKVWIQAFRRGDRAPSQCVLRAVADGDACRRPCRLLRGCRGRNQRLGPPFLSVRNSAGTAGRLYVFGLNVAGFSVGLGVSF